MYVAAVTSKYCFTQELRKLGMQELTVAQSYAIPYVADGQNTVVVSPSSTGKTLSYLLPLLHNLNSVAKISNKVHTCRMNYYELVFFLCVCCLKPNLMILVGTCWQARSVELQVKKILSWLNSERLYRYVRSFTTKQ